MHHFRIPGRCTWARVLDAQKLERREGKDESYWPIGVTGGNLMCLILKSTPVGRGLSSKTCNSASHSAGLIPRKVPWNSSTLPSRVYWVRVLTWPGRLVIETFHLDALRDPLGPDELTSDEIATKEFELDKVLIQLIQNVCKSDKLPRVLAFVKMFHHTGSYNMAAKVAGFYHLIGLQEKIEMLKADREEGGDDEDEFGVDPREVARQKREQWRKEGSGAVLPVLSESCQGLLVIMEQRRRFRISDLHLQFTDQGWRERERGVGLPHRRHRRPWRLVHPLRASRTEMDLCTVEFRRRITVGALIGRRNNRCRSRPRG
ncbi:hypothetical protein BDM02DRAFT_3269942 [Thelephora ganbajun]|uniref:Uncharacterized protein n=1 Tax=Thelephora ganbajun TaxID=370292 RepID=A0ACB6ZF64_THEGA|nr:hypothetical protein BDM02DRAFT_3269942 [Thelephora ganbajun]